MLRGRPGSVSVTVACGLWPHGPWDLHALSQEAMLQLQPERAVELWFSNCDVRLGRLGQVQGITFIQEPLRCAMR